MNPENDPLVADAKAEAERQRQLANRRALQKHEIAMAELDEERTDVRLTRKEMRADRKEARKLARFDRRARVTGARVKIAHGLKNTAEAKAIRLQNVRIASLSVFVPVLLAFAAWSTVGVRAGVLKLIGTEDETTGIVSWGVEPALIAVVIGIIIIRSVLRTANGDLDWRSYVIEFIALSASITLNLAGAWPSGAVLAHLAATIAHSIGPVGAAGTAILISVIDDGISNAKPYEGAESVADPAIYVEAELTRPTVPLSRTLSHGTELGQPGTPALSQPKVSRPRRVPSTVSQDGAPSEPGTDLVPVSQPKVSQNEQFEKVVTAWEAARDMGQSQSVRAIAEATGVSKSTVSRILQAVSARAEVGA